MADPTPDTRFRWLPLASLALAVIAVIVLYFKGGDPMDHLKIVAGYTILILVFFYGLMVLIAMADGTINLKFLVSEPNGHASMGRFQLLIFTFVIGLSVFLIVVASKPPRFPAIPKEILTLLGISATTYAAGKAIQFSRAEGARPTGTKAASDEEPKAGK